MIPLGILAAQFDAPVAGGSYDLLETEILASSAASVTFSSLGDYASTYQHLQIRAVTAQNSGGEANLLLRLNGDTGNNYNFHFMFGTGSSVVSGNNISDGATGRIFLGNQPSSTTVFHGSVTDILDPFETTKNTTTRTLAANSNSNIWLTSGLWRNTNAVTSIQLYASSGNLVANSRFSIYGLRSS